jgi:hypothetical protein
LVGAFLELSTGQADSQLSQAAVYTNLADDTVSAQLIAHQKLESE